MVQCLVVDDDPRILNYIASHLQTEHIDAFTQPSGEAALKLLEKQRVDIAVVDIMMDGMDGFQLCNTLKNDYDIPVIMLTARDALSDKERAFISGTDDYVTKPFEVKELIFRIRAVLRRYNINSNSEMTIGNLTLNQSYLSILELIKENKVTAKAVFDAAKAGDQFCIFITEKVANYIGYLCSIISVTSNPKYIVLGGGMSTAGPILIENIKTEYHNLTFAPAQFETEIVQAKLGNDAGITGAAGLIKTYVLDKEGVK